VRMEATLGDPGAVGFVGERCADGREVILTIGIVHVGAEVATCAGQGHTVPEQVAGGAHRGRVDLGLGEHTTA
jgi:hypothetical protein